MSKVQFRPTTPPLASRVVLAAAGSLVVHVLFVSGAMRGLADVFRWKEAEPTVIKARLVERVSPPPVAKPQAAAEKPLTRPPRKPRARTPVSDIVAAVPVVPVASAPAPPTSEIAAAPVTPAEVLEPGPEPAPPSPPVAPPSPPVAPPSPPVAPAPRPPAQSPLPARAAITFEITLESNNYKVWATQTWSMSDGRYRVFLGAEAKALFFTLGSLTMESQGVITGDGLRPERYVDERNKKRTVVTFTANEKSASVEEANGNRKTVALSGQAADVMSLTYDLAFNPDIAVGAVFTLSNRDNVEEIRLVERREEPLALDSGVLATRFYEFRRPGGGGGMQVWLATERQWLPAKIRILGRDGAVTMIATRFDFAPVEGK